MTERRDPLADDEAELAAAEAGAIGGTPTRDLESDADSDPAMQAVYEGGGGEAEGFELAEQELVEHAEQGPYGSSEAEVRVRAEVDRETEERDPAEESGLYGEPDQEDVTEVVRDPGGGADDPGAGPGIAADR